MKNLDLEQLNLTELNEEEKRNQSGGWLGTALAVIGFGIYLYNEGGDFVDGFNEGRKR